MDRFHYSRRAMPRKREQVDVSVGQRIRALRTAKGLSQEDLAASAGVRGKQVYRVEAGTSGVGSTTLHAIAEALGTTSGYLLTGYDSDAVSGASRAWATLMASAVEEYLSGVGRSTPARVAEELRDPSNWTALRRAQAPTWEHVHSLAMLLKQSMATDAPAQTRETSQEASQLRFRLR